MSNLFESVYHYPLLKPADLEVIAEAHQSLHFKKEPFFIIEHGLCLTFLNDETGTGVTSDFCGEQQILIDASSLFPRQALQEICKR